MSFVCLTIATNKQKVYLRADQVIAIDKNPKNDLETVVLTSILTPQGPATYLVLDDAQSLAKAVTAALKTQEIQVPGPRIQ